MLKHCREFDNQDSFLEFIDNYTYDSDSGEYVYDEEYDNLQPMFIYLTNDDESRYLGQLQTLTMYSDTAPEPGYDEIYTLDDIYCGFYIENNDDYKFAYFHSGSHINFTFFQTWRVVFIGEQDPEIKNITVTLNGVDVTNNVVSKIIKLGFTPLIPDRYYHYRNIFTVDIPYCTGDVVITFGDVDTTESNEDDNNENNTGQSQPINTGTDPTLEPITKPVINP